MEELKRGRSWIAFLGWLNIISGALGVLLGLFADFQLLSIIGGVLGFVTGYFLINAASALKEDADPAAGDYLRKYFTLQGVVALIALIGTALALLALMTVN